MKRRQRLAPVTSPPVFPHVAYCNGMGWIIRQPPAVIASGFDTRAEAEAYLVDLRL